LRYEARGAPDARSARVGAAALQVGHRVVGAAGGERIATRLNYVCVTFRP
jgi:hypothetical protein